MRNRVQLQYLPRWRDIQQIENELFTLAPSHLVLSDVYKYTIQGMFIPQDDIQRRIDEVVAGFSERTIGVHIRRTDNVVSIQSSPLENFTNMMDAEIKKKANTKFYVASDDNKVKKCLKSKYPDRIITLMDNTDRNSLEGMKFAVLDLFCLSKTNKS